MLREDLDKRQALESNPQYDFRRNRERERKNSDSHPGCRSLCDTKATANPACRKQNGNEHERRLQEFGSPDTESRNNPKSPDSSQPKSGAEHYREVGCSCFQSAHSGEVTNAQDEERAIARLLDPLGQATQ
jgi:hypothetical protein